MNTSINFLKLCTAISFNLGIVVASFGQFQLDFGYQLHVSSPQSLIGTSDKYVTPDEYSKAGIKGNLGAGNEVNIALNRVNQGLGWYLGTSYFQGFRTTMYDLIWPDSSQLKIGSHQRLAIHTGIILQKKNEKITIQSQTGLILPFFANSQIEENTFYPNLTSVKQQEVNYRPIFGLQQTLSCKKQVHTHISIGLEMGFQLLSLPLKKTITTFYSENGTNQTSNLTPYQKEIVYELNMSNYSNNAEYNVNYDPNTHKVSPAEAHSFSSYFFGLSVQYLFLHEK